LSVVQELGVHFETHAPNHRMSPLQDLERGPRLKIDETLGYAITEAKKLGVPVPTLEVCYGFLFGINRNI